MKKKSFMTLLCVTFFAISPFVVKTLRSKSMIMKDNALLIQNIEALTQNEGYSESLCPGLSVYADVGITYMEYTIRGHFVDSLDIISVEHRTYCHAEGLGKRMGYEGIKDVNFSGPEFIQCEGEQYHTYPSL